MLTRKDVIIALENAYIERIASLSQSIKELEEEKEYWKEETEYWMKWYEINCVDLDNLQGKAMVYDLLMEMPEWFTLYNHKLYKWDWYAQLDEHDEDFDTDDIVISGWKTPQEALLKLKEKLNLQK